MQAVPHTASQQVHQCVVQPGVLTLILSPHLHPTRPQCKAWQASIPSNTFPINVAINQVFNQIDTIHIPNSRGNNT